MSAWALCLALSPTTKQIDFAALPADYKKMRELIVGDWQMVRATGGAIHPNPPAYFRFNTDGTYVMDLYKDGKRVLTETGKYQLAAGRLSYAPDSPLISSRSVTVVNLTATRFITRGDGLGLWETNRKIPASPLRK